MAFFCFALRSGASVLALSLSLSAGSMAANQEQPGPAKPKTANEAIDTLIKNAKPIFDARLRYSFADFGSLPLEANGLTYRIRAGVESGKVLDTTVLVDLEYTETLIGDFNSTINGRVNRPVVADPENQELNRFQLQNTSLPDTTITLGRQRIIQDDARFIGNVGWRQNEQTYDALRVVNKSIEGLTLDISYVDRINRIFGEDSPQGAFNSDSWFVHGAYKLPTDKIKATLKAFAYLLDFESDTAAGPANRLSTETYGGTVQLSSGPLEVEATFATQSPYGNSTLDYNTEYFNVRGSYTAAKGLKLLTGFESLGSDNGFGFVTPLSTAHKFQGFADLFLVTPANGVQDLYLGADYTTRDLGPFDFFKLATTYHTFDAATGGQDYGDEINVLFVAGFKEFKRLRYLLKFADFKNSDGFAQDVTRLTLQVEFKF